MRRHMYVVERQVGHLFGLAMNEVRWHHARHIRDSQDGIRDLKVCNRDESGFIYSAIESGTMMDEGQRRTHKL